MTEPNKGLPSNPSSQSDENVERVHVRVKEGVDEAKMRPHHHHKETHGLRPDIDEETPITDVKAPNVFERAKEEFEAIVHAIHPKKEHDQAQHRHSLSSGGENRHSAANVESESGGSDSGSEKSKKSPTFIDKAKEDIEAIIHKRKPAHHRHHKETHGTSNDIDETTPIDEIKGPSVYERAKEEVEAILDAIHPKKESGSAISSTDKGGGFRVSVGKGLEKICSPRSQNKD